MRREILGPVGKDKEAISPVQLGENTVKNPESRISPAQLEEKYGQKSKKSDFARIAR